MYRESPLKTWIKSGQQSLLIRVTGPWFIRQFHILRWTPIFVFADELCV
jgi:hypothetical protein